MRRLLIHACCGPCLIYPHRALEKDNDIAVFYYNPNIHPSMEYARRLEALSEYCNKEGISLTIGEYRMQDYFRSVAYDEENRCRRCYELRLGKAASFASENGFDAFTTTLSVSPYQNHDLLKEVGAHAGQKAGVPFVYYDFREGYRDGQRAAAELGMYRQAYCGCVFSELERYEKKLKRAIEGALPKV